MVITHKLAMNLEAKEQTPRIEVSQWDAYTRQIRLLLFEGKTPWVMPEDAVVVIRYQKPDGTQGAYDTLPNGEQAWKAQDHALTLTLAPQITTAAGTAMLYAAIFREESVLTTFAVEICVLPAEQSDTSDVASEDYFTLTGVLPAPEKAQIGQLLRVLEVNENGKVIRVEAVDMPEAGADTDITWADLAEKEIVFLEGYDLTFTDDGIGMESNGIPAEGDVVTVEFDGVSGEYEVTDFFGSLSIEADGIAIMYVDGVAYVYADDTTQPHSFKMTGKVITRIPDRYAAEPYVIFYLDQSSHTYLCYEALGNEPITKDDLLAAITLQPVIISLGNSEFYFPVAIDPYNGEDTYGSATIMRSDGTLETYYTAEYTA